MSIKSWFQGKLSQLKGKGSAFVKIAEADALALEAKGRIIAIDAANAVKHDVASFLEKEATRVHADADKVNERFKAVLAAL